MGRVCIACFSRTGAALARKLGDALQRSLGVAAELGAPARFADEAGTTSFEGVDAWTAARFGDPAVDALVFVGAAGIAVRAIAPHVADKLTDPAVVCVDEAGRFAIPLLSGHVGGANNLARAIAGIVGGTAAVTTATDVRGVFAVDEWAACRGFTIANREMVKVVSSTLLEGGEVVLSRGACVGLAGGLPAGFVDGAAQGTAVHVGPESDVEGARVLRLVPRMLTVGVGCRRGTPTRALAQAVDEALGAAGLDPAAVGRLASIDVKADEEAVLELARSRGWETEFLSAGELEAVPGDFPSSEFVRAAVGVGNVCERAAAAGGRVLLARRRAGAGTTVAIAAEPLELDFSSTERTSSWQR